MINGIKIYTPKPKLAFKYTNRLLPNLPEAVTLLPANHPKVIDVINIKIIKYKMRLKKSLSFLFFRIIQPVTASIAGIIKLLHPKPKYLK